MVLSLARGNRGTTIARSHCRIVSRRIVYFGQGRAIGCPGVESQSVITLLEHARLSVKRAFKDFSFGWSMLIGACIAAVSLGIQVRSRLIPSADWQKWFTSLVVPFVAPLVVYAIWRLLSAPWRVHQDQEATFDVAKQEMEGKIRQKTIENGELTKRLQEVLDATEGPKIYLVWDVPRPFATVGAQKKRIIVENRSDDMDAYKVKILDVSIDRNKSVTATFPEINMIARESSEFVEPKMVGKVNPHDVHDLEMLWASTSVSEEYYFRNGSENPWIKIPLIVEFTDYKGIRYRSSFEFWDDPYTLSLHAHVRFLGCTKQHPDFSQ
jgi:hypothetical protein